MPSRSPNRRANQNRRANNRKSLHKYVQFLILDYLVNHNHTNFCEYCNQNERVFGPSVSAWRNRIRDRKEYLEKSKTVVKLRELLEQHRNDIEGYDTASFNYLDYAADESHSPIPSGSNSRSNSLSQTASTGPTMNFDSIPANRTYQLSFTDPWYTHGDGLIPIYDAAARSADGQHAFNTLKLWKPVSTLLEAEFTSFHLCDQGTALVTIGSSVPVDMLLHMDSIKLEDEEKNEGEIRQLDTAAALLQPELAVKMLPAKLRVMKKYKFPPGYTFNKSMFNEGVPGRKLLVHEHAQNVDVSPLFGSWAHTGQCSYLWVKLVQEDTEQLTERPEIAPNRAAVFERMRREQAARGNNME